MTGELPPRRWHLLLLALGWTAFAVYGSLVPLRYRATDLADAIERFRNLPPLWFGMGTRADWVANILLFIPVTFLWLGVVACDRGRMVGVAWTTLLVPLAAAAAVALEFTQIWFVGRTVSRNDIVAETIGSVIGALLWLSVGQRTIGWLRLFSVDRRPRSRLAWLLEAYLLGLLIYSVIPLDLTVSVAELFHKYQRGQVVLVPFMYRYASPSTEVYQFFADIMEFVPAGAWVLLTQGHRLPARSPVWTAALGGGLIAAAIEFAQLLVLSRYTDTTDIVLGTLGAAIGGWLVHRHVQRQVDAHRSPNRTSARTAAARWLTAIVLYSAFLAGGFWFPFDITHDRALVLARWAGFFRVPLLSLYSGTEFNAVTQVLIRLLLFAPLGAMWGYFARLAPSRGTRSLLVFVGLVYSAGLALGIEAAQIVMPSKVADATEVLLCFSGAASGLFIFQRLLKERDGS